MSVPITITRFLGLCLTIFCLVICYMGLVDYLDYNKGTMITRANIQSNDIPAFAICPQPALNRDAISTLRSSDSLERERLDSCPESGCTFIEQFGRLVEENNLTSDETLDFYRKMKFGASEVVAKVTVTLFNGTDVDVDFRSQSDYQLPIFELIDCPVVTIPLGIEEAAKIT